MNKILIVGAGHSGLHLGHDLLERGWDVTVMTGESSTEIRNGRPHIAQFTLPTALARERALGLDFWKDQAPAITGATVRLYPPGGEPLRVAGSFAGYATAVDRRLKMAHWLEYLEDRGGKVVIHGCTLSDLDYFSRMFDLVVIAVGHGELGALFTPEPGRFGGARPRMLAQALLDNVAPGEAGPGLGEYVEVGSAAQARAFLAPMLTIAGPCHALVIVEGHDGRISGWPRRLSPSEQWERMRALLSECAPDLHRRVQGAELIDGRSTVVGEVRPQVRHPVGVLPSGGCALGLGDVVISTDPIAGQGWATATMSAAAYADRISQRGEEPFTTDWMAKTFELFWSGTTAQHRGSDTVDRDYAGVGQASALLSDTVARIWEDDAPAHLAEVVATAAASPEVATRFIRGLDDPRDYARWLYDPDTARAYLHEVTQRHT